jgi:CubicO group peptidase (beta-lactamase class C family)
MRALSGILAAVIVLLTSPASWADSLPRAANPGQVGLSSERLARIGQALNRDVEQGLIPGAVVLVARKGRIAYFESFGMRDKAAAAPMTRDAIFRIYSMTKPVTSLAVMMLQEEGRLHITDPVAKHLPSLAKLQVGIERIDPVTGQTTFYTVPADRPMTIQDLLRHTSGLTYGLFGASRVKKMYTEAGADSNDLTNAELVERLSKLPLAYQPGTTWEYSRSTDVLGRVVEVVSGVTLGRFFEERIFRPLGMTDSGFFVPRDKHGRIAQPAVEPSTGKVPDLIDVTAPPKYESGGGGAVSSVSDYARFAQMLLNGGQLDGVRLVSRKTIEHMTSDHLGTRIDPGPAYLPGPGYGFGLGFAVRKEAGLSGWPGSAGEYSWGGFAGTSFWVDPREQLVAVYAMQAPAARVQSRMTFKSLVVQSIAD